MSALHKLNMFTSFQHTVRDFKCACVCLCVWLLDIKKLYRLAGVDNKPTVFLFNDTQIVDESFLEDINNILSSGEVPNLYKPDEFVEVCIAFIWPVCLSISRAYHLISIPYLFILRSQQVAYG